MTMRRRISCRSFSPLNRRREEENYCREVAANKISSLKNPGALLRGHLINNDVEEPARRCSLGREGEERKKRTKNGASKSHRDRDG